MKRTIATLTLAVASAARAQSTCQEQAQVCMDAQVDCLSPLTRTALFRCARFSTWCVLHMTPACSEKEKQAEIAALRAEWWRDCMIVTNDPSACEKLE